MSWSSKVVLSLVELIIYVGLTPIATWTLYKHRIPSLYGHSFLYIFITLRIVADALTISNRDNPSNANTTGAVINSVGLSPLLLASSGFVSEARHYIVDFTSNRPAKKVALLIEVLLHFLVVGGVALLATGSSKAAQATTESDAHNGRNLSYAGPVLLLLAWLTIVAQAAFLMRASNAQKRAESYQPLPRLLLTETLISLPFTGVRVVYSMIYTFDQSPTLNPRTASFVVYFFLLFLSQLIAAVLLVVALLVTRNIVASSKDQRSSEYHMPNIAGDAGVQGSRARGKH